MAIAVLRSTPRPNNTPPQPNATASHNASAASKRLIVAIDAIVAIIASHHHVQFITSRKLVKYEYMRRCKAKAWKTQSTDESLKCFNLERILEAEALGIPKPKEVSIEKYVAGSAEM
eukprot:scaffold12414_cov84-Cyclotella_meneghiniana.AAC.1